MICNNCHQPYIPDNEEYILDIDHGVESCGLKDVYCDKDLASLEESLSHLYKRDRLELYLKELYWLKKGGENGNE